MKNPVFAILGLLFAFQTAPAQTVRFATSLGNIDVKLMPDVAPATVQNFLSYMNRGLYNSSFFHRSVAGFIIQGGGYRFTNNNVSEIPSDPPVRNEYKVSNTRGTLAMAKLGNDPNSATNQWFFNLANNSSNLDNQNGGFTVFGQVVDAAGLAVMDRIAAVPLSPVPLGSPFDQLPLQNYHGGTITASNLVMVNSIKVLDDNPAITQSGVISASGFGGFASAAAGSYIEIYGVRLAGSTKTWGTNDFSEGRAPTSLDGVTVTVDGKPAYVYSISPAQVNVQVPANVTVGGAVPVVVTYNGKSSPAVNLTIRSTAGGLLAPASFKVNGKQYAAAVHASTGAFVKDTPAVAGETLTFYGIGFGPVTPGEVAGQVAAGTTTVTNQVDFQFGDLPAQVLYAGLVPGQVGVYQFNVVVPAGVPSGDVQLKVLSAGEPIPQSLFVPVQ